MRKMMMLVFVLLTTLPAYGYKNFGEKEERTYRFSVDGSIGFYPVLRTRATLYHFTEPDSSYHFSLSYNLGGMIMPMGINLPPEDQRGGSLHVGKDWHFLGKYVSTMTSIHGGLSYMQSEKDDLYYNNLHGDICAEVRLRFGVLYLFAELGFSIPIYTSEPERYSDTYLEKDPETGENQEVKEYYTAERKTQVRMMVGIGMIF